MKINRFEFIKKIVSFFVLYAVNLVTAWAVVIPIETAKNALILQTDADNRLLITYFGVKLENSSEYALLNAQMKQDDNRAGVFNHAYTPSGTWNLVEPALSITHSDGNLSTELKFISYKNEVIDANVQIHSVLLKDPVYGTEITLYYKTYINENVIEQWSTIKNKEKGSITLQKYASANLNFVDKDYYLTLFHGGWGREMNPEQTLLSYGIKSLDSKLGTRPDSFMQPVFMVSFDKPATEENGKILLGTLAWSGNYKMEFEVDPYHNLRLIAGINPYSSEYRLVSDKEFETPSFIYTFSNQGIGEASRQLHRWARNYRLLDGNGSRLTLLNNWESTFFDFNEAKLINLFADGKKLGVDLFLLDDGWFANKYPRNDDRAGLGDWEPNRKKLPNGIGYLVKEADKAGIKFGIWIEPEMVNPKSELYEKHPEWVIKQPERPEFYFRNQLVLDLTNPQVQDYVFQIVDNLFGKNTEVAYIKWDCNTAIYNANSSYLQKTGQNQSQLYVDYVKGLYRVLERIRSKYPKIPMMLCSSGGGRVDYGALKYFTEFWPSDNTGPVERAYIQWNYSYFYPAIALCNHITDWSKVGIKYKTDVAMMGKMGYDIVVSNLSEKELMFSQDAVKAYNSVKELVWHGDLYRLASPYENPYSSLMFVNEVKSRAVIFNYVVTNRFDEKFTPTPIRLQGLNPEQKYRIKEVNLYPGTSTTLDTTAIFSGDYLMKVGFNPDLNQQRTSVVLEVNQEAK
ncbi:MAG: alpha-galactosidase [Paludibacter sp.]|nr:alpha-galactosidase [Paludibacter sp.]